MSDNGNLFDDEDQQIDLTQLNKDIDFQNQLFSLETETANP